MTETTEADGTNGAKPTTAAGEQDGAAVRFPPPFIPLIALVVGIALQFPWPLALPVHGLLRYGLGALLLLVGLGAMGAAIGLFRQIGQDPKPWVTTPAIVSTGIYRFTRNPMYLGMGLMQAGFGVALANGWLLLLVPVTCFVIARIAIRHEEAYLEGKFGAEYTDYKARVRRWV
jgi:protein-S-isoprenylcysteine O-methyltransferase Ste14